MSNLTIERDGKVAILILQNAPQNQFNTPFLTEILEALATIKEDREVKALVITSGVEKFFSTGLHLEWLMTTVAQNPAAAPEFFGLVNKFMIEVTGYPKPVIGAITGHCAAMGAIISACMDYRLMNADYGFIRVPEIEINIPFLPGMNAIFKDILPPSTWRDMALMGEKYTGAQMLELGFIDQIHPADELRAKAVELAAKLGAFKTSTFAAIKRTNRAEVLRILIEEDPPAIKKMMATFGA
jgi:enoyl-CoA hydratase/carnithine racemase